MLVLLVTTKPCEVGVVIPIRLIRNLRARMVKRSYEMKQESKLGFSYCYHSP